MRKAFIFDFDDTLANTSCQVFVRDSNNVPCKTLTPAEFTKYTLQDNETFDFSEFRDEIFVHQANPTFLIHLAREVYNEGHNVYVLTARSDCVAESISTWLQSHGIVATEIHCVGSTEPSVSVAESKKQVLINLIEKFDKTYFYDDCEKNVNIFRHEKLRAYQVLI